MELFSDSIEALRAFFRCHPWARTCPVPDVPWRKQSRSIVFSTDTGLELGGPSTTSISAVLWTCGRNESSDDMFTLVGPDFTEITSPSSPFGLVAVVGVEECDAQNVLDVHRRLELVPYDLELEGFMFRSASLQHKPWCRISKEAIARGMRASHVASCLMELFRSIPWVTGVEIGVVTSSARDVESVRDILEGAFRKIAALYRMTYGDDLACETCEYQDVCDASDELRAAHALQARKKGEMTHA